MSVHQTASGCWFCVQWDMKTKKQRKTCFGKKDGAEEKAREFDDRNRRYKKRDGVLVGFGEAEVKTYREMYQDPRYTIADILDQMFFDSNLPLKFNDVREMIRLSIFGINQVKPAMRFRILERDQSTCTKCGRKPPEVSLHVDHIIPLSRGGMTEERNLQTLCSHCNLGKRNSPCNGYPATNPDNED